jgi:hypothetical protein
VDEWLSGSRVDNILGRGLIGPCDPRLFDGQLGTFWRYIPSQSPKSLALALRALPKSEESQSVPN